MTRNKNNKLFDDLGKVATSAMNSVYSAKKQAERKIKKNFGTYMKEHDYVSREEFNVFKDLVVELQKENKELKKLLGAKKEPKKPAAASKAVKKAPAKKPVKKAK